MLEKVDEATTSGCKFDKLTFGEGGFLLAKPSGQKLHSQRVEEAARSWQPLLCVLQSGIGQEE